MKNKINLIPVLSGVILLSVFIVIIGPQNNKQTILSNASSNSHTYFYICDNDKKIEAIIYPVTGRVDLKLSDGRSMKLPQTISADGSRYANSDESFVFWSKGDSATVLENNQEKDYVGCIQAAK